jgi:signal transduction histidine kinase
VNRLLPLARRWLDAKQLVVGLSLVVLALALLAYWAWQASVRRHEVTLELLRSHANLAAQRLGARITDELYVSAMAVFRSVLSDPNARSISPESVYKVAHNVGSCRCAAPLQPAFAFRTDFTAKGTAFAGESLSVGTREALLTALRRHVARMPGSWDVGVMSSVPELGGRLVLYSRAVRADATSPLLAIAADSVMLRKHVVYPMVRNTRLLTVGDTGRAATPNDSLIALRVTDAAGVDIYRTVAPIDESFASTSRLPVYWGELAITASLEPRATSMILPGGVPRSPVPMLIALMATATMLVGAAMLLIWRMHELSRMRADFTSSVSHELRTPLTQILLFAETIEMGRQRSASARAEAIGVITRETRRLIHLVENILQFSRAERSLTQLQLRPQEIGEVLSDTVHTFMPIARNRGAMIELRVSEPVWAMADLDAVRRILLNLLDNAVRYGPPDQQITVSAARVDSSVRITVEDEGPGVPTDRRDAIWQPFVRLEDAADKTTTGCGIGLAIVSDLVSLQHGRRWVGASASGGAAFTVELPAAAAPFSRSDVGSADATALGVGAE